MPGTDYAHFVIRPKSSGRSICIQWNAKAWAWCNDDSHHFGVELILWLFLHFTFGSVLEPFWHCKQKTRWMICGNVQGNWYVDDEELGQDYICLHSDRKQLESPDRPDHQRIWETLMQLASGKLFRCTSTTWSKYLLRLILCRDSNKNLYQGDGRPENSISALMLMPPVLVSRKPSSISRATKKYS